MRIQILVLAGCVSACSDYELNQELEVGPAQEEDSATPDPEPEPVPEEICDGIDNDGDGEVDEGFDEDGDGIVDCEEQEHVINLMLTGDDVWEGWYDGNAWGSAGAWNEANELEIVLDSGPHALTFHVWDMGQTIVGFMADLEVDGQPWTQTGQGSWQAAAHEPGGNWKEVDYNGGAWGTARRCEDIEPWGGQPEVLVATGAKWVWPYSDCRQIGEGFFRLELNLP